MLLAACRAVVKIHCLRRVAVRTAQVEAAAAVAAAAAAAAGVASADKYVTWELISANIFDKLNVSELAQVTQQTVWLGASASFRG
jgi:hypothetical protein